MDRGISLIIRTRGDQSGPEGPATVMAEIVDKRGPEGTEGTIGDQRDRRL